jgi:hypothetical protein
LVLGGDAEHDPSGGYLLLKSGRLAAEIERAETAPLEAN